MSEEGQKNKAKETKKSSPFKLVSQDEDVPLGPKPPPIKVLHNYTIETFQEPGAKKPTTLKVGIPGDELLNDLVGKLGKMPQVIGNRLFWENENAELMWIESSTQILGWLLHHGIRMNWAESGATVVTKAEFFKYLLYKAERYIAYATTPHFPQLPDVYYTKFDLPPPSGAFDKLMSMFSPASELDALMLKAAFMTPFWGGPSGARPGIFLDGLETEERQDDGLGVGKSTMVDFMTTLVGSPYLDISPECDLDEVKKRFLTCSNQRIVRLDNLKKLRFSSAELEGLITSPTISGHRMYVGEGQLPNDFTYVFTMNGVSLSKDLAQRALHIKLARPTYSGNWHRNVSQFIKENRAAIVADIGALLNAPTKPVTTYFRFAEWQMDVLMKITDDPDIIAKIRNRQIGVDADVERAEEIEEQIFAKISEYNHSHGMQDFCPADPSTHCYLIQFAVLKQWLEYGSHTPAELSLRLIKAGVVRSILPKVRKILGTRYWVWVRPERVTAVLGGWKIDNSRPGHISIKSFAKFRSDSLGAEEN